MWPRRSELGRRVPTRQSADMLRLLPRPGRTLDRRLLTVGDRRLPVLRARGGHGRRGRTRAGGLQPWSPPERVGVAQPGDTSLGWHGPPARGSYWVRGSNPAPGCFAVQANNGEWPEACDADSPTLTARARRGPAVPDAVRTQHGPGRRATASLGSTLGPLGTGRSYSWEGLRIARGCPWMTAADRCFGHLWGMASEDTAALGVAGTVTSAAGAGQSTIGRR